ncbi:unnamed protein product [Adineta ricciae]|uniref:Uncharacterized protein n=1 Tax=Adineta ricciae TaxID=249248 RepID=A0A814IVM2_ADIRI|nr:unnamed protein product [Adineta ricciae]
MFEVETKFILQGSRLWPPDIDDGYLRRVLYHDMNKKDENTKPAIHHLVNGPKANMIIQIRQMRPHKYPNLFLERIICNQQEAKHKNEFAWY